MVDTSEDAFKRIIRILQASDQAEYTIRFKLSRAGYSESSIDEAINRALDCHLIDDSRYASLYIRSKLNAHKGRNGIIDDLSRLKIDLDTLDEESNELLFNYEDIDELHRALTLLNKGTIHSKNPRNSAYAKLVRNGYSLYIASSASRLWLEQNAS